MLIILSLMRTASQSAWNRFLITSGPTWMRSSLVGTASQNSTQCHQNREVTFHHHRLRRGQTPRMAPCKPQARPGPRLQVFQVPTITLRLADTRRGLWCWGGWSAEAPRASPSYPGHPARFSTFVFVLSSKWRRCFLSVWAFLCHLSFSFLFSLRGSNWTWSQICGKVRRPTIFHVPICRWGLSWGGAQPSWPAPARYLLV